MYKADDLNVKHTKIIDKKIKEKRGMLVVLEGIDRSGKSTLSHSLSEMIPGSVQKRYPNRNTVTGKMLNEYLNTPNLNPQAAHLIFASNRWEDNHEIHTLLELGVDVIVDRYSYSGVSYSMAKGITKEFAISSERGLILPDLVLYLDINPNECQNRNDYGKESFENVEFQQLVYESYETIWNDLIFKRIDATMDKEKIVEEAIGFINKKRVDLKEIEFIE
jgi:dTMP kinase